jgi:hypothetical protein
MTISTLLKYLIGDRDAILCIARCPKAIWVGLLLVLAAGFAREYDGEDLLHEPWHLLIPLGASLASSAFLYLLVRVVAWAHKAERPGLIRGYFEFLSLYWMTAPLAVLYAVPVERFLTAADSMRANLAFLGLVAVWRVLLMSRIVSVLWTQGFWTGFVLVMVFADTLAATILVVTPLPIVSVMGGIRLSESEAILHNTVWTLRVLSVISWPIWAIVAAAIAMRKQPGWQYAIADAERSQVSAGMWALAIGSLLLWAAVLPVPQSEQRLRRQVELDLRAGRLADALSIMSAHERKDFPPHWDPLPRIAYHEKNPDIVAIINQLNPQETKPWAREVYAEKFGNWLRGHDEYASTWVFIDDAEELSRRIALIEKLPERAKVIVANAEGLQWTAERKELPDGLRERISRLLREADIRQGPNAKTNGESDSHTDSP